MAERGVFAAHEPDAAFVACGSAPRACGLHKLKPGDVIAIALALLLALLLPLLFYAGGSRKYAVINVHGTEIYRAPIEEDAEVRAGEDNIVKVSGSELSMLQANCPDELCMRMRARQPGESVVCLPNGVAAWIEDGGELDGVAY